MSIIRVEQPRLVAGFPIDEWKVGEGSQSYLTISIDDSDGSVHIDQPQGAFWLWLKEGSGFQGSMVIDDAITALTEAKEELERRA